MDVASDDELLVSKRTGAGYEALYVGFSRLHYSYEGEQALRRALGDAFGPVAFATSFPCGPVTLFLFYFDAQQLARPLDVDEASRLAAPLATDWQDQAAAALERAFGERRGRSLFRRFVTPESRSGIYRESTPPSEVPADVERLEALEGRLEVRVVREGGRARRPEPVLGTGSRPDGHPEDDGEPRPAGRGRAAHPDRPARGRRCFLYRFEIEAPADRIAALVSGEERFVEALRALDEGRASDDPLNGLILSAGLGWRDVEILRTLRNHLLQIRTHWNADTVSGVLLRNSEAGAALLRAFAARFDPLARGRPRRPPCARPTPVSRRPSRPSSSLAEDEVLRALDNLVTAALRTNAYQRPERPVVSIKVDSQQVEGMPSPRPLVRDLRPLAAARGHPPARGPGRARRHPLERPPRRLPHRGPGPDEDADGQELGHRAGRLEGRIRPEGRSCRRGPRSTST